MSDPLASLRARFRARVSDDIERVQRLWATEPGSTELRGLVHDLAGTAGMFGYDRLSEAALAIDDRHVAGGRPEAAQMDLLVQRMREVGG